MHLGTSQWLQTSGKPLTYLTANYKRAFMLLMSDMISVGLQVIGDVSTCVDLAERGSLLDIIDVVI